MIAPILSAAIGFGVWVLLGATTDEIIQNVYDSSNTAFRVNVVAGSAGGSPAGSDGDLQMKSGSAFAASAANDNGTRILVAGRQVTINQTGAATSLDVQDNGVSAFSVIDNASTVVNGLSVQGGATGVGPILQPVGATNVDLRLAAKGTGAIAFPNTSCASSTEGGPCLSLTNTPLSLTDSAGVAVKLRLGTSAATAVGGQIYGAAANGASNSVGAQIKLGSGNTHGNANAPTVYITTQAPVASGGTAQTRHDSFGFRAPTGGTTAAVNGIDFVSATTGNSPTLAATGSDTNVSVSIQAKGTGGLHEGTCTTVGVLPGTSVQNTHKCVTDAVACTYGATPTGGGSTFCGVVWTGAAWVAG